MTTTPKTKKTTRNHKPKGKVAYFNRELSWLAFNRRVLEQAQNERFPLMERVRFLSFVCSNLDEFFEVRVAGLVQQVDSGFIEVGFDGLGPKEQLRRILSISHTLVADKYRCWNTQIMPQLQKEGIVFKSKDQLTRNELSWVKDYFDEQVFPVLTPMGIDPAHPFPQLTNKSLNVLVWLKDPTYPKKKLMMAVIPVPRILPRILQIESNSRKGHSYIFLSDIIKTHAAKLFSGYTVKGAWAFRITRNNDLYIDEEEAENLLSTIEEELHKMRKGAAVRLEIEKDVNPEILDELLEAIHLPKEYVFRIGGPINLVRLFGLYDMVDRPDLKFPAFYPYQLPAFSSKDKIYSKLRNDDYMLHHPFDSYTPVVDFIEHAAEDPKVFAIKQTLYRTSGDSPIIRSLQKASENGKQVTALVELKARFDEANNIQWARELEQSGVHVVYGLVGLKTHCKCCLVVRREDGALRRYAHLGTGNYNPKTAKSYTDLSFFTSREEITREVADLFNTLTGFQRSPKFEHLLVAPFNLHERMQKMIHTEARNAKAGKPARIIVKVNSLIDRETIDNLYVASQAGVKIDLIVRGICGLVPGVRGLSDNIRVVSILGRYLEHSRIFYFENGDNEPHIYCGSADWMPRNFYRRIEAVFPVQNPKLRSFITDVFFPTYFRDNQLGKYLRPNGSYAPVTPAKGAEQFASQDEFITRAEIMRKESEKKISTPPDEQQASPQTST